MNPIGHTDAGFAGTGAATAGAVDSLATTAAPSLPLQAAPVISRTIAPPVDAQPDESLFERHAWLYAFFRDRVFRDDTDRIVTALWPDRRPAEGDRLIELGCGPGFYSCCLSARFPELSVLGVDQSARQLDWAKTKARRLALLNCRFETDNVLDLTHPNDSFDVAIATRLFTVLPDPPRAIAEMHRVLKPGGRCLVAEPRYAFWASLPLFAMWVIAGLTRMNNDFREPRKAVVLSADAFKRLFAAQPWRRVKTWQDGRYQYALCEKD